MRTKTHATSRKQPPFLSYHHDPQAVLVYTDLYRWLATCLRYCRSVFTKRHQYMREIAEKAVRITASQNLSEEAVSGLTEKQRTARHLFQAPFEAMQREVKTFVQEEHPILQEGRVKGIVEPQSSCARCFVRPVLYSMFVLLRPAHCIFCALRFSSLQVGLTMKPGCSASRTHRCPRCTSSVWPRSW